MANDEDDILRDAIIATDKEIFANAFGEETLTHDETGDRSLEEMGDGLEGQVEPEDEEDDDEPDGDLEPIEEQDKTGEPISADKEPPVDKTEPQGRVPAGRLREEAERARAAIAERDTFKAQLDAERASSQKAIADLNAKVEAILALQQRPSSLQPQPETPVAPDLFEDPNAFAEHINKGVSEKFDAFIKQMRDREVNASIEAARTRHGQTFEEAIGALKGLDYSNPDNIALVKRMEASSNPGEAVVSWHKRSQAIREVGDDLDAYKARIAEDTRKSLMSDPEFRKELLASLRGEALTGDRGQPRTSVKLPKSLSQSAGNNGRAPDDLDILDGSDRAIFASVWPET